MIALWHKGRYYDSFYNTLLDSNFMEVTMVQLGFNPLDCEWIDYGVNLNGHNPRQFDDSQRSCKWLSNEIEEGVILDPDVDPVEEVKKSIRNKIRVKLFGLINKQEKILRSNLIDFEISDFIYEEEPSNLKSGVLFDNMKLFIPKENNFVFKNGLRFKKYHNENKLPEKYENLKDVARFLISRKVKWNKNFMKKLKMILNGG